MKTIDKESYWLLTIQRGSCSETIVYEGDLILFILIENELGQSTSIIWSKRITKENYDYFNKNNKKL